MASAHFLRHFQISMEIYNRLLSGKRTMSWTWEWFRKFELEWSKRLSGFYSLFRPWFEPSVQCGCDVTQKRPGRSIRVRCPQRWTQSVTSLSSQWRQSMAARLTFCVRRPSASAGRSSRGTWTQQTVPIAAVGWRGGRGATCSAAVFYFFTKTKERFHSGKGMIFFFFDASILNSTAIKYSRTEPCQ